MEDNNWRKIKSGDKTAFRVLFDEYYFSLCLYANSIINDMNLSQDIVSDCFVKLWERRGTIQIESSVNYYLSTSVKNSIYSYLRSPESRKVDFEEVISNFEHATNEEYNIEKDQTILQVQKLIEKLPEQRKRILELAAFKGKTYPEIAAILNISVNTVKTQMARSYRFLREELGKENLLMWFLFMKLSKVKGEFRA